jgi:hypothetical protein
MLFSSKMTPTAMPREPFTKPLGLQTFAKTIHGIPAVYWKSPGEGILTPSSCCRRRSFRHKYLDDGVCVLQEKGKSVASALEQMNSYTDD